jgi:hypothetical protein
VSRARIAIIATRYRGLRFFLTAHPPSAASALSRTAIFVRDAQALVSCS